LQPGNLVVVVAEYLGKDRVRVFTDSASRVLNRARRLRQARDDTCHGHGPELAVSLTEKLTPTLTRIEREMIKAALRANEGHLEATAKALGISRKGLYLKRQRLGV